MFLPEVAQPRARQKLVGIVSLADLATGSGSTQLTGQTLEGISQSGMPRGIPVVEATPY